ncbi:MAG: endo alpha-1,4 polygalactosaminidase [Planctomycetales bacterium]|nr:endo alpha-1,4 polygalactosaminidase [Planctomycetales bacterium]
MRALGLALGLLVMPAPQGEGPAGLRAPTTWMYQLEGLEEPAAVEALARSAYDLLVVEPTATLRDQADFDVKGMVSKLHAGRAGRRVLAYLDVGEAESYRAYWGKDWRAPGKKQRAIPEFILRADPDGWGESYVVAYWDPRWQRVVTEDVRKLMAAGFDGLYLDWVAAYEDEVVEKEAERQGLDPARAMVDFVAALRKAAREARADAWIVPQNAADLWDRDDRYAGLVDALAFEDTWFRGDASAKWDSPKGGDIPNTDGGSDSTPARVRQYKKFLASGKKVLTVDYCVRAENAALVYEAARREGFVPLVTRVSLSRLTPTPPPWLGK